MNDERLFYQPLLPGHIRVLQLDTHHRDGLRFELIYVDLRKNPTYSALSYTWGSNVLNRVINVNKHVFKITENLHNALMQFHAGLSSGKETAYPLTNYIWIDAICINQSTSVAGLAERSTQVNMMTEIYMRAAHVYVWLGIPANKAHNRLAEEKMRACETSVYKGIGKAQGGYRPWWWPQKPLDAGDVTTRIKLDITASETAAWTQQAHVRNAWQAIMHWWNVPWWTRAWALQEGSIPEDTTRLYVKGTMPKAPKATVRFVYGDVWSTWARLINAMTISECMIQGSTVVGAELQMGSTVAIYKLWAIRNHRVAATLSSKPHGASRTLGALSSMRLADCSDCRDKIYAARGFITMLEERAQIIPDYQKAPRQVYIEVAAKLLQSQEPGLEVLGYTCHVQGEDYILPHRGAVVAEESHCEKLPSWVPNWNAKADIEPLPKILHLQRSAQDIRHPLPVDRRAQMRQAILTTVGTARPYNACGQYNLVDARVLNGAIQASAVFFDILRESVPFSLGAAKVSRAVSEWKKQLGTTAYPNGQTFDAHLWRTQWADVRVHSTQNNAAVARMTYHDAGKHLVEGGTLWTKLRSLGVTGRGHLALVPSMSRAGDLICMLFGGQVLHVLRPKPGTNGRFEYVGEAYVHDMMDGAVADMVMNRQAAVQRITIE